MISLDAEEKCFLPLLKDLNPKNPEALNFGQSLRLSHPTRPIFRQLAPDLAGEALVLLTPNSGQTPLFRGALVAFTGMLLQGPQFRSGSALGPVSRPPLNSGPRPLFRVALVAPASALLRGPQLRSGSVGRYPGPPE